MVTNVIGQIFISVYVKIGGEVVDAKEQEKKKRKKTLKIKSMQWKGRENHGSQEEEFSYC